MRIVNYLFHQQNPQPDPAQEVEAVQTYTFTALGAILRNAEQCQRLGLWEERNEWLRKAQKHITGMRYPKHPLP